MRKITIYQTGNDKVELYDNSEVTIEEIYETLKELYKCSNIVILETTSGTFIGRPSEIKGVIVNDVEEIKEEEKTEKEGPDFKAVEKDTEKDEDIITDMD